MIRFDDLTEEEKQNFTKCINKSVDKKYTEEEMQVWPDDDEEMTKSYFEEKDSGKDGLYESY